jgi:hypothetical protein
MQVPLPKVRESDRLDLNLYERDVKNVDRQGNRGISAIRIRDIGCDD